MSDYTWFTQFNKNLYISADDVETISYRYKRITKQLNKSFYDSESDTLRSLYVGSYGRDTDIHVSDIDMLFELPWSKFTQYDRHIGNGQSALLQELKASIIGTYPKTSIGGDGQVVVVEFGDRFRFEVVPAFKYSDGTYCYPDTNGGGSWETMNPKAEMREVNQANARLNKHYKRLCRMTRAWRDEWSVDISGILIDTLAYHFISNWEYINQSYGYYDYLVRDFFLYMYDARNNYSGWKIPGSNVTLYKEGVFTSKSKTAYDKAVEAINAHSNGYMYTANGHWHYIYGSKFPPTKF